MGKKDVEIEVIDPDGKIETIPPTKTRLCFVCDDEFAINDKYRRKNGLHLCCHRCRKIHLSHYGQDFAIKETRKPIQNIIKIMEADEMVAKKRIYNKPVPNSVYNGDPPKHSGQPVKKVPPGVPQMAQHFQFSLETAREIGQSLKLNIKMKHAPEFKMLEDINDSLKRMDDAVRDYQITLER